MNQNKQTLAHTGVLGEEVAAEYYRRRNHRIIDTNYRKPYGEIDVITRNGDTVCFVEVKSVSYETKVALHRAVSRETQRPEERVDARKLRRIHRAAETWLTQHPEVAAHRIDVLAIHLVPTEQYAVVSQITDVTEA